MTIKFMNRIKATVDCVGFHLYCYTAIHTLYGARDQPGIIPVESWLYYLLWNYKFWVFI